jgi:hypothetical protein
MGGTGNLRTLRNQSGSNGSRTLSSILASDSVNGAGSVRRIFHWYVRTGNVDDFYNQILNLRYGKFRDRTNWFLSLPGVYGG